MLSPLFLVAPASRGRQRAQSGGPVPAHGSAGVTARRATSWPLALRAPPPLLASGPDLGSQSSSGRAGVLSLLELELLCITGARACGCRGGQSRLPRGHSSLGKNTGAGSCLRSALSACSAAWLGSAETLLTSVTRRDVQARASMGSLPR